METTQIWLLVFPYGQHLFLNTTSKASEIFSLSVYELYTKLVSTARGASGASQSGKKTNKNFCVFGKESLYN